VVRYDGTFDERLEQARGDLNEPFKVLFDEHLTQADQRLRENPGDHEAKVDFVTLYHMIIEGTLALSGQNFITTHLEDRGILPGFLEGFRLISQDEHRHVAYGTWFLREKCKDPALKQRCQAKLAELLPVAAGVFVPPGLSLGDDYEIFGFSSDEVNQFAFTALTRRLKVIGIGMPAFEEAAA
jgi:ribonucleoside-diphosphate reductase beta chain